jgi:uncharacterized protein with NRDE domain
MCLIALAHGVSERYPLVLAANRDEDYERETRPAHPWEDADGVIGGRDVLHGGSWLAVSQNGRFAAVTNLHGAPQRSRSRGLLVSSFVTSREEPEAFAASVASDAQHYAGFHLIVGEALGTVVYVTPDERPRILPHGIYGFSNAPSSERWPKVDHAVETMKRLLETSAHLEEDLLRFLSLPLNRGRVEEEVFIAGERYGTRASSVVIVTSDEVRFAEQNYARGGVRIGETRRFRLALSAA